MERLRIPIRTTGRRISMCMRPDMRGKALRIQEAQTLGCAIVASECNREQITDGEDGIFVRA